MVNTAGGITGGDKFRLQARAKTNTRMVLTTQAAERVYRAQPDQWGRVDNRITIETGARINWMPQETILFNGCALERSLKVDMAENATFLMVEPLVFGRKAMGETLTNAHMIDRVEIRQSGRMIYQDALRFSGDICAHMARPNTGANAGAMASLVFVAPNAPSFLKSLRGLLNETSGASLLDDSLLVLRLLAPDSYLLRQSLLPILNLLSDNTLPRCWMI